MYGRFVLLLYVLACLSTVFGWISWRKRDDPGGTPMVVFHVALAIGAASYALDISVAVIESQLFWREIATIAQGTVAISWLYAALQYANFDKTWTRRLVGLLALDPLLFTAGFLFDFVRIFQRVPTETTGSITHGSEAQLTFIYSIHFAAILVAALAGTLVLVQLFVRSRHLYRTQSAAVLVAALAPWSVALTQQYFLSIPEDATIFAWGISGAAMTMGLYTFKTLDPVPAAQAAIVHKMGDGTVVLDVDGYISDVNPAAATLLGHDEEELVGRHIDSVLDDWSNVEKTDRREDGWTELELDIDGNQRFLEVEATPFTDRFDDEIGTLVVLRDVSQRQRREQRLAQFKTIFDSVTEPVYVLDAEDRFLRYNEPFADLVGYDESDLVGERFDSVLGAESMATDGGAVTLSDTTVTTESGVELPCEADLAPVELADGETGRVGIIRDISRRKEIESELAETEERLETLVEASPLAIITHDTDGIVDVWNPAAESLFGWSATEVRGDFLPIIPDENEAELIERHQRVQSGEGLSGWETELLCEDGQTIPAAVWAAPIRNVDEEIIGTVAVIADISERKARQRKLRKQNERLDEFAGLVSHDLRNPLQVAAGNLELAQQAETEDHEQFLEKADQALERMEALIDDTLKLARKGQHIGTTETESLGALADQAWTSVKTEHGALDVADPPTVVCDPDRVVELLENLFNNAVTHGHDGSGTVTVTVGALDDGFYVEDDGTGIPESKQDTVLQSGYTTADDGTGIGLAIVDSITEAHGWDLWVTESEGGGARFEFSGVECER